MVHISIPREFTGIRFLLEIGDSRSLCLVLQRLVLRHLELTVPDVTDSGKSAATGRPASIAVVLPFLIAEKDAGHLAFEGLLVPFPVISGVRILYAPDCVVERTLRPAVLFGAVILRDVQAVSTAPLLVLALLGGIVLLEEVLVIALCDVKGDQENASPIIGDFLGVQDFGDITANRELLTRSRLLRGETRKCFHCLLSSLSKCNGQFCPT